ncbi:MAG: DUF885 family protein, partial [Ilumatobacteraceae bacterium]
MDEIERWEDLSGSGVDERLQRLGDFTRQADRVVSGDPHDQDASLLAAVSFSSASTASLLPWVRNRSLVSGPFNFSTFLSVLVPGYSLVTAAHGEGYITKVRGLPSFIDGWIDGLRAGLAEGHKATARGITSVIAEFDRMLDTEVSLDPLVGQRPPSELTAADVEKWRNDLVTAVGESARPAIRRLRDVLQHELFPGANSDERPGLCHLPDGARAYEDLLFAATSTNLGAEAVHEIGVEQLGRLDDEYRQLAGPVLGVDDPQLMRDRLRSDTDLQYTSTRDITRDLQSMLDRARLEAPHWFGRLPRAECDI